MSELAPATALGSSRASWADRLAEVVRALSSARPSDPQILFVRAEAIAPEAFLAGLSGEDWLLFAPGEEGEDWAGVGAAAVLVAGGAERFERVRTEGGELLGSLAPRCLAGERPPRPRLLGGFAFHEQGGQSDGWRPYGSARFVLPRLSYVRRRGEAWVALVVAPDDPPEALLGLVKRCELALSRAARQPSEGAEITVVERGGEPRATYEQRVAELVAGIREGRLSKVMTARELQLELAVPLDPLCTLRALEGAGAGSVRFAFGLGESVFLGATPEKLIERRGARIRTEALAGTIGPDGDAARLLQSSEKDLQEHGLVVRAIVEALRPLCARLDYPSRPGVRRLRHLLHLCTPFDGELAPDAAGRRPHVVSLVQRLHPTPAVGGLPRGPALEWIARREPLDRGWYAGAVGWFDATGDGQFNVALRSGLCTGRHVRLFAGAGIVSDSVPASEYDETGLKLSGLMRALRGAPQR